MNTTPIVAMEFFGQEKPASKIVLNLTLEHDWMLEKQGQIVAELLEKLRRHPAGTYVVGINAYQYTVGHTVKWGFDSVGLKVPHNLFQAFPFYAGTVQKV